MYASYCTYITFIKKLLISGSAPLIIGICVGSAAFVVLVVVSVCLTVRRRSNNRSSRRSPMKQFLLPKDVKPVIGFKTAAGPGGLKKSPRYLRILYATVATFEAKR